MPRALTSHPHHVRAGAQLDERKATILRAVVADLHRDGAAGRLGPRRPRRRASSVSPATVRNDMAALEQEGYLHQPHTSAGRVPTDKGYRFFVDRARRAPRRWPRPTPSRSGRSSPRPTASSSRCWPTPAACCPTSPSYAAVVVGPPAEAATVRSVQLVGLAPRVALVVVVLSNGAVDKHTIELDRRRRRRRAGRGRRLAGAAPHRRAAGRGRPSGRRARRGRPASTGADAGRPVLRVALGVLRRRALDGRARLRRRRRRAWPRRSTRSTPCARCCASSSSSTSWSALLHDVLDRGLHVAIGTETGIAPLADCSVVVAPYEVDGEPAGTIGVLGPDPHELPAGPGRGRGREPAPRPPPERGLTWPPRSTTTTSCSASRRDASRRRDQAGLPPPGPRAAPRRQPRRPRGRGAVQGGGARLRDAERPRAAPALRPLRPRGRGRAACPAASAGGLGDLFDAFFGGQPASAAAPGGPAGQPRGADLEAVIDLAFEEAVFGTQAPVTVRTAVPCDDCEATGAAPGTSAVDLPGLRRRGPGAPGAPVAPRPDGHRQPLPALRRARARSSRRPCPTCRGEGRRIETGTYTVDVPAGIDTGSTLRLTGRGAVGPRGGGIGRPLRPRAGAAPRPLRAPRLRPGATSCTCR